RFFKSTRRQNACRRLIFGGSRPMLLRMTAMQLASARLISLLPLGVTLLVTAILVVLSIREQGRTVVSM
ncbi:MAG: hypothetical protein ACK54K_07350, partial [Gemmatimonadaceae bacterium]